MRELTIDWYNNQRNLKRGSEGKLAIYRDKAKKVLFQFLNQHHQIYQAQCSVNLCAIKKIKTLNRKYRAKDYATDVLSFPVHKQLDKKIIPLYLGDIFICRNIALKQSLAYEVSYEHEIIYLFLHGFLHLCGYDHERSVRDEKIMDNLQKKLMKKILK